MTSRAGCAPPRRARHHPSRLALLPAGPPLRCAGLAADNPVVKPSDLAVVQGWAASRAALTRWRRAPVAAAAPWLRGALVVAAALLAATWVVASLATPDPAGIVFPGVTRPAHAADYLFVLARNALVLALHALAGVAGFIAGASLPMAARDHRGAWRRAHDLAGPLAMAFVLAATLFSLATQALALGEAAAGLGAQLSLSPALLLLGLAPHAVPELVALFLPLAAWTAASRRSAWDELLAATAATVALAVPVLLVTGAVEVWVTPRVLLGLAA